MKKNKFNLAFALAVLFAFGIVGCSHDGSSLQEEVVDTQNGGGSQNGGSSQNGGGSQNGGSSQNGGGSHNHTYETEWSSNEAKHWHASTCGHDVKGDEAAHVWNHEDYQYDATLGYKIRTCTVCGKVLRDFYSPPLDVSTGLAPTASSSFIYFGVFPQTVLAANSSVAVNERDFVVMGANTYYKGSDGNYYAKVKEKAFGSDAQYKYTDGTQANWNSANNYRYFKVEPIKWKVLTTNYNNTGKSLLLAEGILTANVPYCETSSNRTIGSTTVYANNYKYSTIRAYLNGKYESDDTQSKTAYENKGFLQTAFTAAAQVLIAETNVDNRKETTGYSESTYATNYACENTLDKIFLLSESEVISSTYGFAAYNSYGQGNARIRMPTDYAMANYAYLDSTAGYGGYWWLRSPFYNNSISARHVYRGGYADYRDSVDSTNYGVVPALSISLQ